MILLTHSGVQVDQAQVKGGAERRPSPVLYLMHLQSAINTKFFLDDFSYVRLAWF